MLKRSSNNDNNNNNYYSSNNNSDLLLLLLCSWKGKFPGLQRRTTGKANEYRANCWWWVNLKETLVSGESMFIVLHVWVHKMLRKKKTSNKHLKSAEAQIDKRTQTNKNEWIKVGRYESQIGKKENKTNERKEGYRPEVSNWLPSKTLQSKLAQNNPRKP